MVVSITLWQTKMDTQNDGLEKLIPLRYGHLLYLCSSRKLGGNDPIQFDEHFSNGLQ